MRLGIGAMLFRPFHEIVERVDRASSRRFRAVPVVAVLVLVVALSPARAAPALAPVADAGHGVSAHVGDAVTIDGSGSYDPAADAGDAHRGLIAFHWTIARAPAGSVARIDAASPVPVLVPDLPGAYVLQLAVVAADGSVSVPAQVGVDAYAGNAPPVAFIDAPDEARTGAPVDVDGDRSFDPDGGPLAFRWSFASVPRASRLRDADLSAADGALARFTPDVEGDYVVALQAGDGEFVTQAFTTVHASAGLLAPVCDARAGVSDEILLDGSESRDPDANPAPLRHAWSLVARPGNSAATRNDIRDADSAQARFTPDTDGIYVFRLRVDNGSGSDACNVWVRAARDEESAASRASSTVIAAAPSRPSGKPDGKDAARAGVAQIALNLQPRSLDLLAGDSGTVAVRLVATGGGRDSEGRQRSAFERQPKARGGALGATLDVIGLPPGATAQFGEDELAPGETTNLTVTTSATTPSGTYRLRLTVAPIGATIAIVRTASVTLHVRPRLLGGPSVACGNVDVSKIAHAVYVSAAGSDTAGCGQTPASACATIQRGIDGCTGSGCTVLVRYGRYRTASTIELKDGVSVYGGCTFAPAPNSHYRTLIDASPAPDTPAIRAAAINAPTMVQGLEVIAADRAANGAASIAMAVEQSKGLALSQVVLVSGRGGDGTSGGSSTAQAGPGAGGQDGASGGMHGQSCPANRVSSAGDGGDGQISTNGFKTASGCVVTHRNSDGQSSGDAAGGAGGAIGTDGKWCPNDVHGYPGDGGPGQNGANGTCGAQARASPLSAGSFTGTTWAASRGDAGQAGLVGAGGGGGGAGGVCADYFDNAIPYYGLAGGGGGGGGCGGEPGGAGQQGGASIPLVIADSSLVWEGTRNALVPGPAGKGGDGGSAAAGGRGGGPGAGVTTGQTYDAGTAHYCGGLGASGGSGGFGGAASAGAGGNGGPSIGIALLGASPVPASDGGIYSTNPGAPGHGGTGGAAAPVNGACSGPDGQWAVGGLAAPYFNFNDNPPRNFLASGDRLVQGQSRVSLDGNTEFVLQTDGNLCLYKAGHTYAWCSLQTENATGDTFVLNTDGSFCLLSQGSSTWCAELSLPGAYMVVTNDGRVVMYEGLEPVYQLP